MGLLAALVGWAAAAGSPCPDGPAPRPGSPRDAAIPDDLLEAETAIAARALDRAMRHPAEFPALARLHAEHPRRYALLMEAFEAERRRAPATLDGKADPYAAYTAYVHALIESSEAFARASAAAWEVGFALTPRDVVPKLEIAGFPSTRRVAIAFLAARNGGDDLGFRWCDDPGTKGNAAAIRRWQSWLEAASGRPASGLAPAD